MLLYIYIFCCIYLFLTAAACDCIVSLLEESGERRERFHSLHKKWPWLSRDPTTVHLQHIHSPISHSRPAPALNFRLQSPVLPVLPAFYHFLFPRKHRRGTMSMPSSTARLSYHNHESTGRKAEWQQCGQGCSEGGKQLSVLFHGGVFCTICFQTLFLSFFPFFKFFPPKLIPLKKVINIQNIVAQINSYTPAASAPTKPMPVHVR